ncbi:LOB domain-containing protein 29 [Striga hermonthica]|uniref:LOB domain-containing protein 29 n=1 Tax=Striga hermonthica TaxID=68872 RepID=A0A9N7RFU3_STRHE|nr:LOB domain-containing protein 29 [Striga hermonthica]
MTGSGSPCGACKFLRRKCVKGCVFAPYFSHEQGSTHFSAIHKVFGASNVSKLLAQLPVNDRCEAAVTIAYEAQARVQDPIYGCVSHIFALQQQVMYLQAQVASLREQAAQCIINSSNSVNPNYDQKFYGTSDAFLPQDIQSWLQNQITMPQFEDASQENVDDYFAPGAKCENPGFEEEKNSFDSMDSVELQSSNNGTQWFFQDDADDLQSVAFRYMKH